MKIKIDKYLKHYTNVVNKRNRLFLVLDLGIDKENDKIIIYSHLIPKTHEVNNTKLFFIPIDCNLKQTATVVIRFRYKDTIYM